MRVNRLFSFLCSFVFAFVATFAVTANAYGDSSHPTRITVVLLVIILMQALVYRRLWLSREVLLNVGFLSYEFLSLAWTEYIKIATATLPAMVNATLTLILFSALVAYHDLRALLSGMFAGFLAAAVLYTLTSGYPFTYPEEFSYNTIAGMYLFGLFVCVVFGAFFRLTVLPVAVGLVLLVLIAATTSIKTNLGIALGILGAGVLYFKLSVRDFVKSVLVLAIFGIAVAYVITSNPTLTDRVQLGFDRVSTGLAVLTNRENDSGNIGLGTRQGWKREGLKGWYANPVFGHGVEGFRADFAITSHSTPIDLLYNSGLIGLVLFYGMLASIAWRLLGAYDARQRKLRARIAAFLITYTFISLSGILYYDQFLPIYVAIGAGLMVRLHALPNNGSGRSPRSAPNLFGPAANA